MTDTKTAQNAAPFNPTALATDGFPLYDTFRWKPLPPKAYLQRLQDIAVASVISDGDVDNLTYTTAVHLLPGETYRHVTVAGIRYKADNNFPGARPDTQQVYREPALCMLVPDQGDPICFERSDVFIVM